MNKIKATEFQLSSHFKDVASFLKNRIKKVIAKGGIYELKPNKKISGSNRLNFFLKSLENDEQLKKFLNYNIHDLKRLLEIIVLRWPESCNKTENDYKILHNIFVNHCYVKFNKTAFIENFDLNTCPYCNRNYIYKVGTDRIIKPEIDHFFPVSRYPILAISFYNLIPSCQTCNGFSSKGSIDSFVVGLKSPYEISSEDFVFSYDLQKLAKQNALTDSKIEVVFKKKIQVNSDLFNLEELYKKHDDHVAELIFKSKKKYADKYRTFLVNLGLGLNDSEINRLLLSTYTKDDELTKRPLTKLYQDIAKELGLI